MDYIPKFIDGLTVAELKAEIDEIYERQYIYGCSIDRPRLWDLQYTIKILSKRTSKEAR